MSTNEYYFFWIQYLFAYHCVHLNNDYDSCRFLWHVKRKMAQRNQSHQCLLLAGQKNFKGWDSFPYILIFPSCMRCNHQLAHVKYFSFVLGGYSHQIGCAVLYSPFNRVKNEAGISSWDWTLNGQSSTYHALFPRAWTIYEGELPIIMSFLLFGENFVHLL